MANTSPATIPGTALKFKVAKHVTLPLLKMKDDGSPIYVKIESQIFRAKKIEGQQAAEGSNAAMAAPELMHVVNLETGEVAQLIVSTVMGKELGDKYPENSYVGKSFEIRKYKMSGGKRYATFQIAEIELEPEEEAKVEKIEEAKLPAAEAKTNAPNVNNAQHAAPAKAAVAAKGK